MGERPFTPAPKPPPGPRRLPAAGREGPVLATLSPEEIIASLGAEALVMEGFDAALVGTVTRYGWDEPVALYDRARCIALIMAWGWSGTVEAATDYFEVNCVGTWAGPGTPVFLL